tara:strand:+ start:367 stop:990 length:624 start_codon:yes stop_codon:yes gene_type:complete
MSGIVGSINTRGSGLINLGSATDGQVFTGTGAGLPVGFEAAAGGGKVLQCIQTHSILKTSQSLSASTYANITNLNKAITPTESDSNILVDVRWCGELNTAQPQDCTFAINRDSTAIGLPAASGVQTRGIMLIATPKANTAGGDNTPEHAQYRYLDTGRSAGTDAITYHATISSQNSLTMYNNRTVDNANTIWNEFLTSTIILWEISA